MNQQPFYFIFNSFLQDLKGSPESYQPFHDGWYQNLIQTNLHLSTAGLCKCVQPVVTIWHESVKTFHRINGLIRNISVVLEYKHTAVHFRQSVFFFFLRGGVEGFAYKTQNIFFIFETCRPQSNTGLKASLVLVDTK